MQSNARGAQGQAIALGWAADRIGTSYAVLLPEGQCLLEA